MSRFRPFVCAAAGVGLSLALARLKRAALPLLAWGLVLHSLAIAVLVGAVGLDMDTARVFAAWKEMAIPVMLVAVIVRSATRPVGDRVLMPADFLAGGLIALALSHLVAAESIFRFGLPSTAYLLGFRDAAYFVLIYFVGRGAAAHVGEFVGRGHLFFIAAVTSIIAIGERLLVTPELLVALGIAAYFQDFLGVAEFTAGNVYGLPMNYWANVGGVAVQRAGSVFLSGQGFAVPFLLLFPATLVWAFDRPHRKPIHVLGFVAACIGLLLTITRTTIAVAFVQLALYVTLKRKPEWAVLGLILAGGAAILAMLAFPTLGAFVWQTLTWQEQSAAGHAVAWRTGLEAFFERPWGWGLGTADQTAVRAGMTPLTGDNLYLKYAVEMGILGVGLLVALLFSIAASAYRLLTAVAPVEQRRLGMVVFLATIGIAINALTASVFNSVPLAWLYFLAAGAAVTHARRAAAQAREGPAPGSTS